MALTVDSKIKEIMANPEAVQIVDKHSPGFADNKQIKMVYGISLRALQKFPQTKMSLETLEEINNELSALS